MMASSSKCHRGIPEKQFQAQIIQLARMLGWLCYHTHDSRRSEPGWPDLALTRPRCSNQPARLVLAELKSDRGRLTPAQSEWLRVLSQVPGIEVFCWRPSDFDEIIRVLRADAGGVSPDRLASLSRHTPRHRGISRHQSGQKP